MIELTDPPFDPREPHVPEKKRAPSESVIGAIMRGLDALIEPGRTTTTRELSADIIAALAEAGYKILPREPSDEMVAACSHELAASMFRAMWDAAE
jgi:hypothetical protein